MNKRSIRVFAVLLVSLVLMVLVSNHISPWLGIVPALSGLGYLEGMQGESD